MFTNTHLTQATAREAIEYRVRDAESLRSGRIAARTTNQPNHRVPMRLARVRRAGHRLA